jgi:hypothetical protein
MQHGHGRIHYRAWFIRQLFLLEIEVSGYVIHIYNIHGNWVRSESEYK